MTVSMRLQVLSCLVVYATCAHAIMVKFGTKGGPIEPPAPTPPPPPRPARAPAPVWDWDRRSDDQPDPNAQWRPQLFKPQPRFTEVAFNQQPLNNAQRFVNAYKPTHQPIPAQPMKDFYFTPAQILSSQSLPGFGIRYFVPAYLSELQERKAAFRQEDARHNQIETNEVDTDQREAGSDAQWKYEKDQSRRDLSHAQAVSPFPYQWPAYVPHQ